LINTAIILAGGKGTRLQSIVSEVPKPMAPINGVPFLEIQINYWIGQGITNFILSVGYKNKIIVNHFGYKFNGALINYTIEDIPLGTGGAILKVIAENNIKEPFLLLNGDTYFDVSVKELYEFHSKKGSNFTFSVFKSNNTSRYLGLNVDSNMKIVSSNLIKEQIGTKYVNGGVYIINPEIINYIEFELNKQISLESEVIPILIYNNISLYACEFDTKFIDIGIPEDYFNAQNFL
jgi:D-glycero-alpha-D-manno-heptose 1-phosphate guanylyltransferase